MSSILTVKERSHRLGNAPSARMGEMCWTSSIDPIPWSAPYSNWTVPRCGRRERELKTGEVMW